MWLHLSADTVQAVPRNSSRPPAQQCHVGGWVGAGQDRRRHPRGTAAADGVLVAAFSILGKPAGNADIKPCEPHTAR